MVKLSKTNHNWSHGKKRVGPTKVAITTYFDLTIPYKNGDEAQQMFLEDLVLYICYFYFHVKTFSYIG